nr:hypothetical protein [Tanacetum cinerariifolium]
MVAYLTKSDASEGFNQLINFMNGSYIKYALTVNPDIYVSCIKQFWNIVAIKQVNDVTRLQSLVDKKKVVITEAAIKEVLRLDDAEGVDCLPNEEIFAELARMGYENPSTKLTFYKSFFSSKWKFLIHTILQAISAKRTSWNKFSSAMASAVICLSTGGDAKEHVQEVIDGDASHEDDTAAYGEVPTVYQEPSIPYPSPPTPPPQPPQDLPSTSQRVDTPDDTVMDDVSNQGRIIDELDKDDVVALIDDKEDKKEEEAKDEPAEAEVQEVVDVVTTTKLITEVVTAAGETVTAASTTISIAEPHVPAATRTDAPVRVTAASIRRRKGVVIRDPKKESTPSSVIPVETKFKDKGKGIMVEEPKPLKKKQQVEMHEESKEDPTVQRYQVMKRKPQTEAQARKNMIMYLKNVVGFRLDYFKGMSYDDIRLIFEVKFNSNMDFLLKTKEQMEEEESRALQSINETPTQKAAKRMKLNKEVEDLKRHLEIMPDEDNDVYTEATPLARKALWNLVKERFFTSKPKNFSDDFLLTTLGAMFKKPDGQDQVWRKQRPMHGQAKVKKWKLLESCGVHIITFLTTQLILLVERSYPLSRFTLDQMLNVVRLQMEEESEMSLELLRFTRQQHQEGQLE